MSGAYGYGPNASGNGFSDSLGGNFGFHESAGGGVDTESMIWTITTVTPNFTFRIQSLTTAGLNNYDVDWGDGSSESGVTIGNKEHLYVTAGTYEIKVKGDIYIRNTSTTWSDLYTEWKQWGSVSKLTSVREWFNNCRNMTYTATDAPTFDLKGSSSYWGPYRMFFACQSITYLDVSNWDVSGLTGTFGNGTFQNMIRLTYLNISNWDLSTLTAWNTGLSGIGNSTSDGCELVAPNVNLAGASNVAQAFLNSGFKSMNVENWKLRAAGVNLQQCFRGIGNSLPAAQGVLDLDLSTWQNTATNITTNSGALLFYFAKGLKTLNITNWDLRHITTFQQCFTDCQRLEYIVGLQNQRWDANTNMNSTFINTFKLKFDTYNFSSAFGSSWSVTSFSQCFYRNGYSNIAGDRGVFPEVSNWNMANATNVNQMFRGSKYNGTSSFIPSASWDLSNITSLKLYFYDVIGVQNFDWVNVTLSSSLTNMSQFITKILAGNTLASIRFGANCDFSGVTTFANFSQQQNLLTTLTFSNSVSFAAATNFSSFANSAPLSTASYDAFLLRLDATNTNNNVVLFLNLAKYTPGGAVEASRTQLVTPTGSGGQGWTITDGGPV